MIGIGAGAFLAAAAGVAWFGWRERNVDAITPPPRRPAAAFAGAGIAVLLLFLALTFAVAEGRAQPLDLAAERRLYRWGSPGVVRLMAAVSDLCAASGSFWGWALLLVGLRIAGVRKRLDTFGAIFFGHFGLELFFKNLVDRPRPPVDAQRATYSYPSGHTLTAVILSGALLFLLFAGGRYRGRRGAWALAAAWPLLVGFSRLDLGRHYLTDVAGSLLLGAAWICTCWATFLAFGCIGRHAGEPEAGSEA